MFKKIKTDIITDNESIDTLSKILEKVTLIETQLSKKEYDEYTSCDLGSYHRYYIFLI